MGGVWGHVNRRFRTPANAAIAVGVLAAMPILVVGPVGGFSLSIAATGLIYLSYFLCNIGVMAARMRGWPRTPAWFNLGRWGKLINILAIVYGGLMLINIAIWQDRGLFGDFGGVAARSRTRSINTFIKPFGNDDRGCPRGRSSRRWSVSSSCSVLYYVVSIRGRAADVEAADAATGEAVIG